LYVCEVEVEVEVEWMDDVFVENHTLSVRQNFAVNLAPLLHRHLKEVRLTNYILDLISLNL